MKNHDALVRSEFTRQADVMANAALFNDANVLARICEVAQLSSGSCALDVACGPGIIAEALARQAGAVFACDITPQMLKKTRERIEKAGLRNVRCVPGRVEALPFADGTFDVVVSRSAVHHFADPVAAFREMARVLRPGGRTVTVDVMASENPDEAALHNALETIRDPSHVRMLPRSALHAAMQQAGLVVESCVTWTNHREFDEWLKITNAPERIGPLKTVMGTLAAKGAGAGLGLRLADGKILFEHTAGLTVAAKARG